MKVNEWSDRLSGFFAERHETKLEAKMTQLAGRM
jgi:hypothetical protein